MDSEKFQDVNFIAALALHSHRRDQALYQPGYVSGRTKGLLWFYNKKRQEETSRYARAVFCRATIAAKRKEMKALLEQAQTTEDNRPLLRRAIELQADLEAAVKLLDKLNITGAEQPQPPKGHQP